MTTSKSKQVVYALVAGAFTFLYTPSGLSQKPTDVQIRERADSFIKQMSLEEKLQFIASKYPSNASPGGGAGLNAGIPRLGIPDLNIVDSATGSGSTTQPSTTFPATIALAASWDPQLSFDYGVQVAKQLRAQGFGMGLGGGVNLTREPRAGRVFEYLGEDRCSAGSCWLLGPREPKARKSLRP